MKKIKIVYLGVGNDEYGNAILHTVYFVSNEVDIRIVKKCLIVWDSETGKLRFMTPLNRVIYCFEQGGDLEE